MCGILGGSKFNWNYDDAISTLFHRGPNGQSVKRIKDMVLCFARLSIIDLNERAMQPMISEDERYAIVFNGEIYDYKKIRCELQSKGYHFRTESDTEILLYAFAEWKEKVMDHVDGICAFAVLDTETEKLYLFRDRCGVKPLYYYHNGSDFAFASELKGIKTLCTDVNFTIDNTALYDYHTYLYIPAPKTMYKNVYKLQPAHYLVYDTKHHRILELSRYWKVKLNTKEGSPVSKKQLDEKAGELRYHLDRAVARQLIADVPVGTFLSGGVDSSIITAVAYKHMKDVTAYTIGFPDKRYDESIYAKEMADIIHVNCKSKYLYEKDFKKIYDILPELYDEPYADTSAYPTYYVSKTAKEDVTVVLTGDGGDELFGGYNRYFHVLREGLLRGKFSNRRISELYMKNQKVFSLFGMKFKNLCMEDVALLASMYYYNKRFDRNKLRKKYGIPKDYDDFWYYRKYYHKELPIITRMRYLDFMTYLNGDILTKVDRASMKVSLEARVPFLDKEVIDFAFSLTQEECNPAGQLKGLLKHAYRKEFPGELLDRKKQGFSVPFSYIRQGDCPQEYLIEKFWRL